MRQASSTLTAEAYVDFKQKLLVHSIAHQYEPAVGESVVRENPDLFYVVAGPPGVHDRMQRSFRGTYLTRDERTSLNEKWPLSKSGSAVRLGSDGA